MQFTSALIAAIAATSVANAAVAHEGLYNATTVVSQTVTAYETYCPESTTFTKGTKTYTATKKEWVTVTDCSPVCTITNVPGVKPTVVPVGPSPKYNNGTGYNTTAPYPTSSKNGTAIISKPLPTTPNTPSKTGNMVTSDASANLIAAGNALAAVAAVAVIFL